MLRFVKPVAFAMTAVQWIARYCLSQAGGVEVVVLQCERLIVFLRSEVFDMTAGSIYLSTAVATEEALFLQQTVV